MLLQRRCTLVALTSVAVVLLVGCATRIVTVTVTAPPETVVVTATPSSSPLPTPEGRKALTVCMIGEPDTLYLYGGSRLAATRHVMEALYDGPIDYVSYTYQPTILQKVPSIADGDAITRTVRVREGEAVVDATGAVVELLEGVRVRPAGCRADECEIEFAGEPLQMERVEVTFELRKDVTWADGEALTAQDSVFAYQVASDVATPGGRELAQRTQSYRTLGERRVRWIGLPGFVAPTYFLNFFAPLPRHQLEDRSPAALVSADDTRRAPLGWGPFVVEEWVRGDHMTLSRNPHYFRAAEGLPQLDEVVFRFAGDAPEMIAAVLAGGCDIGVGTGYGDFEPFMPVLVQAELEGLLRVVSAPSSEWVQIDLGIAPVAGYRQADFFGDVRTRQAIAQCIDRQAILDQVAYGRGIVLDGYLPPQHPLSGDPVHWGYDPAGGQTLLEEVGWLDEDGDGVREAHRVAQVLGGTRFEVTLLLPAEDTAALQVARAVKASLTDCGVRVNLETLPSWELLAEGPEGPFFGRQFDLAETTRQLDAVPPCELYVSSQIPDTGRWYGGNASGYSNTDYDTVCHAGLLALPGTPGYEENHRQAHAIFAEELPAIPLFAGLRVAVARPNVLDFAVDTTAPSELWNIGRLDVE